MCFLYLLLFHSPQSILSLWVNSSMSRWMTRNRETLLMPASSKIQKRQTYGENIPPLAKRWSRNRPCHHKLEDYGDIGSTCWHWPGDMDSNAVKIYRCRCSPSAGRVIKAVMGQHLHFPMIRSRREVYDRWKPPCTAVPCLIEKLLPGDYW